MGYLNFDLLESFDAGAFQTMSPYPHLNPEGALTDEAYRQLLHGLPDTDVMRPYFGVKRKNGQQPHDRWVLEYTPKAPLSEHWRGFMAELQGARYKRWIRRMFGRSGLFLSYHWHYAPVGASVSPHCDSVRKLGSHIFYMNDPEQWDPAWGGETIVLDDGGAFQAKSAPRFEDFRSATTANAVGNRSFLFARRGNSWHGVRPITCPEGRLRKVFIVVINDLVRSVPYVIRQRVLQQQGEY